MSIYSKNETGTRLFRSRLNIGYRKLFDMDFAKLIPFCAKFILPGDIGKIGAECFIRYQPTIAPPLTRSWARLRWFFVPLRLVESRFEEIVTGSKNGKLITTDLPECNTIFSPYNATTGSLNVEKYSFLDYMGCPIGDYRGFIGNNVPNNKAEWLPAMYWMRAYLRIWFDYYRDENLFPYNDFEQFYQAAYANNGFLKAATSILSPSLHKDYFTSALPWQLKGVAPTFDFSPKVDFSAVFNDWGEGVSQFPLAFQGQVDSASEDTKYSIGAQNSNTSTDVSDLVQSIFERAKVTAGSMTLDDLRTMAAQTRVFERLARCGSRYTEYLHANFGVAPADGTLQRAQYLGGFSQPIVTTEVVQTGGDSTEVGTLRGHGISSGGNSIGVHKFKEFGVLFGLIDVMPELVYTQGIPREYTYKSRFDFFNPTFQHLSEQEVRNAELYVGTDGENGEPFGYQAIYNELRTSHDQVVGDLRDQLSYWQQAITFSSRPNLNQAFIQADNYLNDFKRPFQVLDGAMPIICDIGNHLDFWRPMVRYGTPGLVDHL